jgi:hypothetical protein
VAGGCHQPARERLAGDRSSDVALSGCQRAATRKPDDARNAIHCRAAHAGPLLRSSECGAALASRLAGEKNGPLRGDEMSSPVRVKIESPLPGGSRLMALVKQVESALQVGVDVAEIVR